MAIAVGCSCSSYDDGRIEDVFTRGRLRQRPEARPALILEHRGRRRSERFSHPTATRGLEVEGESYEGDLTESRSRFSIEFIARRVTKLRRAPDR